MANQSIEECGFASLELADTGDVEASFGNARGEFARLLGDRLGPKLLSEVGEPHQPGRPVEGHVIVVLHS
ncbi:MAG: hypothetical protein WBG54_13465 [Acidobacteriaceae bacterium]